MFWGFLGLTALGFGVGFAVGRPIAILVGPLVVFIIAFTLLGLGMLEGEWGELAPSKMVDRHMDEFSGAVIVAGLCATLMAPATLLGIKVRNR